MIYQFHFKFLLSVMSYSYLSQYISGSCMERVFPMGVTIHDVLTSHVTLCLQTSDHPGRLPQVYSRHCRPHESPDVEVPGYEGFVP